MRNRNLSLTHECFLADIIEAALKKSLPVEDAYRLYTTQVYFIGFEPVSELTFRHYLNVEIYKKRARILKGLIPDEPEVENMESCSNGTSYEKPAQPAISHTKSKHTRKPVFHISIDLPDGYSLEVHLWPPSENCHQNNY